MGDFFEAMTDGFGRAFDFRGRSTRSHFWYLCLGVIFASVFAGIFDAALFGSRAKPFTDCVLIVFFIPLLAADVRRLHDTDHSGMHLLGLFLPIFLLTAGGLLMPTANARQMNFLQFVCGLSGVIFVGYALTVLWWRIKPSDNGRNRFDADYIDARVSKEDEAPGPVAVRVPALRKIAGLPVSVPVMATSYDAHVATPTEVPAPTRETRPKNPAVVAASIVGGGMLMIFVPCIIALVAGGGGHTRDVTTTSFSPAYLAPNR